MSLTAVRQSIEAGEHGIGCQGQDQRGANAVNSHVRRSVSGCDLIDESRCEDQTRTSID
jgi:hypothetical protein